MDEQEKRDGTMKTMKKINKYNRCRQIRLRIYEAISSYFGLDAGWVQKHIASCQRCQRRLAAVGKVNLALLAMKCQPHRLDLLMRANMQAIGVLRHSLRREQKAQRLAAVLPEPKLLERWSKHTGAAVNMAACVAILVLTKVGVFSSMERFQTEGRKVVRQYYTSQVGKDLTNEIFQEKAG